MAAKRDGITRLAAVSIVLLVVTIATRALWWGNPVADTDEQLYSLIGNGLLHGELPFVDNWDRKPFGLFALYALAHAVFGAGPIAYQLLTALFSLGGALILYALARELVDRLSALAAAVIYLVLLPAYGSHSGQSEALFVPVMLGALALVRDPAHPNAVVRNCAAMLLGGLALQIKYTVLPQCVLIGLWALWSEHRRGVPLAWLAMHAAVYLALGLLPTALVGLFYLAAGHWDAFVFANFVSFFDRLPGTRLPQSFMPLLVPVFGLALGGVYAALRIRPPADMRSYGLYLLYFLASLATVYLPSTVYGYYYAALLAPTLLAALPFLDRRGPLGPAPAALFVVAALIILHPMERFAGSQKGRASAEALAAAIAPHVNARECLWVFDGPTALYQLTPACRPSRFVYPDHLNNALETEALGISQTGEVRRILATRPAVIVTADTPFTVQNEEAKRLVQRTVRRHYAPLAARKIGKRTIRAWLRRPRSARLSAAAPLTARESLAASSRST
ncbi:glycosyltransferase family 39 protein [Novosphingobium sp. PC22D]|uniref:ArnT family glycosyltransferase n=1 Tax=Novosphingobium sp. PC22D TaxID=1962403 RepID=UPI00143B1075|nr:glycosyltransferase family 39 protein [Novosphingobium sp. PC22D]